MPTAVGTNCVTKAEDAIVAAWSASSSWWDITETTDAVEAAKYVSIDEIADPDNGYAFTLQELEQRRVQALVLADPEDGFSIVQGEALGHSIKNGRVLIVVEQLIREIEINSGDNYTRVLKNRLVTAAIDLFNSLNSSMGPRWMDAVEIIHMPVELYERRNDDVIGRRLQATIAVNFGPGEA